MGGFPRENRPKAWQTDGIGFGRINGTLALVAVIEDRVVLFPPADDPDFYDHLPANMQGANLELLGKIRFGRFRFREGPVGVVFEDRLVVCPDVFHRRRCPLLVVPKDDGPLHMLYPCSKEELAQLKRRHPEAGRSVKMSVRPPASDTGHYPQR